MKYIVVSGTFPEGYHFFKEGTQLTMEGEAFLHEESQSMVAYFVDEYGVKQLIRMGDVEVVL